MQRRYTALFSFPSSSSCAIDGSTPPLVLALALSAFAASSVVDFTNRSSRLGCIGLDGTVVVAEMGSM